MKTPEENKCGMECIRINVERSCVKPEKGQCPRCKQLVDDSLARIQQLEARLAQVERERDAAVNDLTKAMALDGVEDCSFCKNIKKPYCDPCKFEWRGVCEENTKDGKQDENV